MKSILVKFVTLSVLLLAKVAVSQAEMAAPPQPPATNPHPPVTEADKKRVEFAEKAAALFFKEKLPANLQLTKDTGQAFQSKSLTCLKQVSCYAADRVFVNETLSFRSYYGDAVELRHAHLIPWAIERLQKNQNNQPTTQPATPIPTGRLVQGASTAPALKDDEYMVHIYVDFGKEGWYHLDVIMTEDKQGNLFLRHFFVSPMMSAMPPGIVC